MITPDTWVHSALTELRAHFGPRLQYVGLQGSYRRGEATESSDIDLVVLLDTVSLADLDAYRSIVRALPEGEKACGFIAGLEEFRAWPRYELFPFRMDTRDYHGNLDDFMPPVERRDIEENVRIGLSGLYHGLTHTFLYSDEEGLRGATQGMYKSAGFVVLVQVYLRTGHYYGSRKELIENTSGVEREILTIARDFDSWVAAHDVRQAVDLLHGWCRDALTALH